MQDTNIYMQQALAQARRAAAQDEVPVGAVLVDYKRNIVIATSANTVIATSDPTAHAEINVIRQACREVRSEKLEVRINDNNTSHFSLLTSNFLSHCDLYITLEPCAMCAQAISNARIRRVYFGAYDPKSGGVEHGAKVFTHSTCHHKPEIYGGIMEEECGEILKEFFKGKR